MGKISPQSSQSVNSHHLDDFTRDQILCCDWSKPSVHLSVAWTLHLPYVPGSHLFFENEHCSQKQQYYSSLQFIQNTQNRDHYASAAGVIRIDECPVKPSCLASSPL
ncbi:uncharacterized [Tachysurus ichikawai]